MLFFDAMASVKGDCYMVRERISADIKSGNKIPERVRDVLGPNYNTNPIHMYSPIAFVLCNVRSSI